MKIRHRRKLPDNYLTNTQELMTFTQYTQLIYEFDQIKLRYKHRRHHSILKQSYIKDRNTHAIDFHISYSHHR